MSIFLGCVLPGCGSSGLWPSTLHSVQILPYTSLLESNLAITNYFGHSKIWKKGKEILPAQETPPAPVFRTVDYYLSGAKSLLRRRTALECQKSCQADPACQSWSWTTLSHRSVLLSSTPHTTHNTALLSVPGTCSHNYGEIRGKVSIPGANVVSGPRCCKQNCVNNPLVNNL